MSTVSITTNLLERIAGCNGDEILERGHGNLSLSSIFTSKAMP